MRKRKDGRLAFQLLSTIGVVPSREEKQLLTAPSAETESDEAVRVNRILADLIKAAAERASIFGYREPALEADLKKVGGRINYETGKIEPIEKITATCK